MRNLDPVVQLPKRLERLEAESLAVNDNCTKTIKTTIVQVTPSSGLNAAAVNGVNANSSPNATVATMDVQKLCGHLQDQELFLQAFEKPTQIYRFLRSRHAANPMFLLRTLSYMKDRMSRNNKSRANFKVDTILETVTKKRNLLADNYLSIILTDLCDDNCTSDLWWDAGDAVQVQATLYKIIRKKRKDSTSDVQEISSTKAQVIYKAKSNISKYSVFSIPVQSKCALIANQRTMYKLLLRIKTQPKELKKPQKNIKQDTDVIPNKRNKQNTAESTRIYGYELLIFDKSFGCIREGDYEVALKDWASNSIKSFSSKKRTWETLPSNYKSLSMVLTSFNTYPILKFRLIWSAQKIPNYIPANELGKYGSFPDKITKRELENAELLLNYEKTTAKEKISIVYNFLYSNNTHQQTEYTQQLFCPWCNVDCLRLYALLKHLKLCHARFNFTYQPGVVNSGRIDVTINDAYDGSYTGSPYDLAGPSGCLFPRRCGPVRRTSVTNLLVCRPRRQKSVCLEEFLVLDEDDLTNQRPYITGHNRLYHHTETCLPVHPKELDIDSEGESDPLWLRQKTIQMIDEFSDVNEGEKELMKLWNLHVMKHGYVGDCQLPLACDMFLETNGNEIIQKNLYRNFILHMSSLFDYGLVSPETVYKTIQKLQSMLSKYGLGQQLMSQQRSAQLKYWRQVGIHKQDGQKLNNKLATSKHINSGKHVGANEITGSSATNKTSNGINNNMLPPVKRLVPAVKRALIIPLIGVAKQPVAKKSAIKLLDEDSDLDEEDEQQQQTKRERRSTEQEVKNFLTNRQDINEAGTPNTRRSVTDKERSVNLAKRLHPTQANKRRLLGRDKSSTPPTTKRLRNSLIGQSQHQISNKNHAMLSATVTSIKTTNTAELETAVNNNKNNTDKTQNSNNTTSNNNNNNNSQRSRNSNTTNNNNNNHNNNTNNNNNNNNRKIRNKLSLLKQRRKTLGRELQFLQPGALALRTRLSMSFSTKKKTRRE